MNKLINTVIVLAIASLLGWALVATFQAEQKQKTSCAAKGMIYYQAWKTKAICIKAEMP